MKHNVSDYVEKHKERYLLVNSISRRVHDLQSGYKPLVPPIGQSLSDVATEEFRQSKIEVTTRNDEPGYEPAE